jgi:hypothetical protein
MRKAMEHGVPGEKQNASGHHFPPPFDIIFRYCIMRL